MPRVLLVEDDHAIRVTTQRMLERAGYEVQSADRPAEALRLIETSTPDLIITDLSMPDMSGRELVRQIREKHPAIPAILTSAYAPGEVQLTDAERVVKIEATLVKPFRAAALLETVQRVLGMERA